MKISNQFKFSCKILVFHIYFITFQEDKDSAANHDNLKKVTSPTYVIPLRTDPPWGLRDVFFTPGLHLVGDKIAFIKQMPMFETPTIGK